MRIILFGNDSTANLGDQAILIAMMKALGDAFGEVRFTILSKHPDLARERLGHLDAVERIGPTPWLGREGADIAHLMVELGIKKHHDLIWADSAEPKSIDEIAAHGFNIKGAPKGPGSVEYGHSKVRQYNQFWTPDSLNCIKERRNFRYIEDKDGRLTLKTIGLYKHGMDARRYGVVGMLTPEPEEALIVHDAMEGADSMDLD
ncbi:hypothetical protein LCGC14_2750620 [marine sediment metagenome]|uniref:Phage terminase large subunit C-terminal domain-containing protein n=1 Tax=marine sediment metagenome TaxID=412755 RepID=A0A0F8ZNX5_9ZZZZ